MPWPTDTDYNEAVQNPRVAFADAELQGGQPELTPLGLPRPYTGAFATVYKFVCGAHTIALRCFNREVSDQQARYAAISEMLARTRLPYTVRFEYLARGIRVRGRFFPVLKMEWVQGEGLARYIERSLHQPAALIDLAGRWQRLAADLRAANIAHGDLQHGNVLIAPDGGLKLIDYDGMWVPALAGRGAHELGQKNYQHPRRGTSDFGAHIDHFSHWVIYLSLVALAAQPALWQRLRGGDECLLLRRADFEKPGQSAAINALLAAPDSRTSQLAQAFQALLALDPKKIPPLGAVPAGLSGPPEIIFPCDACGQSLRLPGGVAVRHVRCPSCGWVRPEAASAAALPEWMRDHLPQHGAGAETKQTGVAKELPDLTWIFDGLSPSTQRADFENVPRVERIFSILCSFICIAVAVAWAASLLPGVLVLVVLASSAIVGPLFIWLHYREQPAVIRRRSLKRDLAGLERELAQSRVAAAEAEKKAEILRKELAAKVSAISGEQQAANAAATRERDTIRADGDRARQAIARQRQTALDQEAATQAQLQRELGGKIAARDTKLAELAREETAALDTALQTLRRDAVQAFLKRFPIRDVNITGIGPKLLWRLMQSGVLTAADVSAHAVQRVSGVGPAKAAELLRWRRHLEPRAPVPPSLPTDEIARIRARSNARRAIWQDEKSKLQAQLQQETAAARSERAAAISSQDAAERNLATTIAARLAQAQAHADAQRQALAARLAAVNNAAQGTLRAAEATSATLGAKVSDANWKQSSRTREMGAYRHLSFGRYCRRIFRAAAPS